MDLRIVQGADADAFLQSPDFRADWLRLYEQCPWATAFQHPDYGTVWYRIYRQRFEPVLVLSRDERGVLDGLLALALSSQEDRLFVAGARQAEYQTWICPPASGGTFAWRAMRALQAHFPRGVLTFQYLPPGAPIEWLAMTEAQGTHRLDCHRRLLVRLNRERGTESSLGKKKTRYRLKQLEKLGTLEFKRIDDVDEFREVFDTIITFYDLRQEAMHGLAPFRTDDLKKELILARMASGDARLHVTVLKVGDQIASAHVGFCSRGELHLGLLAHNPFLAKHSPGKFHILFLAEMLKEAGCQRLDLTAGEDAYKESLANDCDEVHTLTIFLSAARRVRSVVRERVLGVVAKGIRTCGLEPGRVKSLVGGFRSGQAVRTPLRLMRRARRWIGGRSHLRLYSLRLGDVLKGEEPGPVQRDSLADLLTYQASEPGPSRQAFLATALARLEGGLHVYTDVQNGRLVSCGWLAERQDEICFGGGRVDYPLPPGSTYLFDFSNLAEDHESERFAATLRTMIRDAARVPGTQAVFITVPSEDRAARDIVEAIGFVYERSLECRQESLASV
jgi:CelD/BcsL family acetyltransferase involved in cellulose biosynthesis